MGILDSVLGTQNTGSQNIGSIEQLAQRFGLDPQQVQNVVSHIMPALSAGMMHHAQQNGSGALQSVVQSANPAQYAEQPEKLQEPQAVETGNSILSHIFGNKDISRQVAESTEQKTGIQSETIKKMLPLIAIMAVSALHKRASQAPISSPARGSYFGQLTQMAAGSQHQSIASEVLGMLKQRVG